MSYAEFKANQKAKRKEKRKQKFVTHLGETKEHLYNLNRDCLRLQKNCAEGVLSIRELAICITDLLNTPYLYSVKELYCDNFYYLNERQEKNISELGNKAASVTLDFSAILQNLSDSYDDECRRLKDNLEQEYQDGRDYECASIIERVQDTILSAASAIGHILDDINNVYDS